MPWGRDPGNGSSTPLLVEPTDPVLWQPRWAPGDPRLAVPQTAPQGMGEQLGPDNPPLPVLKAPEGCW
jgi:hypothetical protein